MRKNITKVIAIMALVFAISLSSCKKEPDTCTNGVKDATETGVDCGGDCSPCSSVSSCTDGVQNGDETGVDCGGSCSACVPAITKNLYFTGEVNSVTTVYQTNYAQYSNSGQDGPSTSPPMCTYHLGGGVLQSFSLSGGFEITNAVDVAFTNIHTGDCYDIDAIFNGLFSNGSYDYHQDGGSSLGVEIGYYVDGVEYTSTEYGVQPSSSNFTIVSSEVADPYDGALGRKLNTTFSCKVKNDNGDELTIENAEMVVIVYNW